MATCDDTKCTLTREAERTEGGAVSVASENETEAIAERLTFVPAVDIVDGDGATRLLMDRPGVDTDGVDIDIDQDIMTIRAKSAAPETCSGCKLVYSEYRVGDYQRSFSLSENVDKDKITATVKNGVLEVVLPKAAPVTKKITVTTT